MLGPCSIGDGGLLGLLCRYVIARISKSTVREFILGVLLVPSIVIFSGFQL
jgi:fluoride ion exporter CrcB/FEX